MTDERTSELSIKGANVAPDDFAAIVDTSDTGLAASGTDKQVTTGDLFGIFFAAGAASITGATTAMIGRMHVCADSDSPADYTVTVPAASGNAGKMIGFRIDPGLTTLVTLQSNSSETIDGATTRIMWAGESAILISDGSHWFKIAGRTLAMSAELYASASGDVPTSPAHTKVLLDTIVSNLGGMADTANGRFVIKRPSVYLLLTLTRFCAASPNHGTQFSVACERVISGIHLNGVLLAPFAEVDTPGNTFPTPQLVLRRTLAGGDIVESYAIQTSGTTQGFQGYDVASVGYSRMTVIEVPQW
jgi:hypothetical protein